MRRELSAATGQMVTAVSTAGSKAQGMSFKEAGVLQGKESLLFPERPRRKWGRMGQAGVLCAITKFVHPILDVQRAW